MRWAKRPEPCEAEGVCLCCTCPGHTRRQDLVPAVLDHPTARRSIHASPRARSLVRWRTRCVTRRKYGISTVLKKCPLTKTPLNRLPSTPLNRCPPQELIQELADGKSLGSRGELLFVAQFAVLAMIVVPPLTLKVG